MTHRELRDLLKRLHMDGEIDLDTPIEVRVGGIYYVLVDPVEKPADGTGHNSLVLGMRRA